MERKKFIMATCVSSALIFSGVSVNNIFEQNSVVFANSENFITINGERVGAGEKKVLDVRAREEISKITISSSTGTIKLEDKDIKKLRKAGLIFNKKTHEITGEIKQKSTIKITILLSKNGVDSSFTLVLKAHNLSDENSVEVVTKEIEKGSTPSAESFIKNKNSLHGVMKYLWDREIDTTTIGEKTGKVRVVFTDDSFTNVSVTANVKENLANEDKKPSDNSNGNTTTNNENKNKDNTPSDNSNNNSQNGSSNSNENITPNNENSSENTTPSNENKNKNVTPNNENNTPSDNSKNKENTPNNNSNNKDNTPSNNSNSNNSQNGGDNSNENITPNNENSSENKTPSEDNSNSNNTPSEDNSSNKNNTPSEESKNKNITTNNENNTPSDNSNNNNSQNGSSNSNENTTPSEDNQNENVTPSEDNSNTNSNENSTPNNKDNTPSDNSNKNNLTPTNTQKIANKTFILKNIENNVSVEFKNKMDEYDLYVKKLQDEKLIEKIKTTLNSNDLNVKIFEIHLTKNSKEIETNEKRTVRIALATKNEEVFVYHIAPNGALELINSKIINGNVEFTIDHFSKFALVTKNKTTLAKTGEVKNTNSIYLTFSIIFTILFLITKRKKINK